MTCAEFYQLMANPTLLSEKTIPDLQQIVIDFPYFHAARMLYLKNLSVNQDIRQNIELKKMAIHIPDRIRLFLLIEGEPSILPDINPITEATVLAASSDYTRLLEDDRQAPDTAQPKMQHQDLIDSFIRNEQTRSHSRIMVEPGKTGIDSDEMIKEQENLEQSLENSYFTETLANIYIKQKRYDKALEIIKRLSLKYPKKNIYFADQIRYLEKLIIHTKK
jgi:tetratricopeptide (TPR) repeat protein